MYRRPKFLEILHEIRQEMARETDYEIDSFAKMVRYDEGKKQKAKGKMEDEYLFESLISEKVSKTKK